MKSLLTKKEKVNSVNADYNPFGEFTYTPEITFPSKRKYEFKKSPIGNNNSLTISSQALEDWLNNLNSANGVYFLEVTGVDYNLHYKDHATGKLMNLDFQKSSDNVEEPKKEFLDKLLFDLSLFEGTEPILVFNKNEVEKSLSSSSLFYTEYSKEIFSVIERLVDMEQVFKDRWYFDSNLKDTSLKSVQKLLFPKQIMGQPILNSCALYQILMAMQNIHLQFARSKMAA